MEIRSNFDCCATSTQLSCDTQVAEASSGQIWSEKLLARTQLDYILGPHRDTGQTHIFIKARLRARDHVIVMVFPAPMITC